MPNFSRSSFIPKSVALSPKCIKDPLVLELKSLNNNLRRVDAYIVLGLNGKRKLKDEEEKRNKQSKRRERESSLERQRKANPLQFFKDSLPRTGFLDAIRNFILYTVMGKMVPFVLKNLPAILNATKLLIPVYNFFENFLGNTLKGLVNAIDFGYSIHDKMRKILKDVTGNKFEKTFDDLEKNLNTFLNVAIIAGLAIGGAGIGRLAKFKKTGINSLNVNQLKKLAKERGLKNYGKLRKAELVDLLENKPKLSVISPPTKRPKIPSIPGAKFFGKFGKVFGRIPIVGGLIDFALSLMFGEKIGRAAARAVGSTLGAALGTFIPIPGVGTIIGGILGDIVGGALYDTLESFNSPKKMASGGQVGRKSANVTRKIRAKRIQKPTKQITQRTMPGKNVGGRENIEKLFPSSDDPNTMSPLRVLTKNSSVMKGGGVLGKFLSSGVELMALGQKMERSTLIGLEKYLAYVIDSSIQEQSNENSKRIAGSMLAMAEGGLVPVSRTITEKASPGSIVAKDIVKSFNSTMNTKSAEILQNIKKEISLFKPGATPGVIESGFGGSGSFVSGDYEELLNLIAERESKDSGGYNAYNEGGAGGGYEVIGYRGPAIKGPIGKNLTDMTIAEIMEHQANKNPPIHAAGRYQIIGQTMKGLLSGRYGDTGVKTTDKFTPEIQDKLAIALIRSRLSTGANTKNFINEWRGLLFVDQNKLQSAIEKAKGGKINLNFGASTNLGMTYRTNTMNNQYYGAPRPGRIHAGVDLDLGSNDSQITFLGGIVQYIGHQKDSQGREYGYGKFVDILTPTGMIERLAELGTLDPSVIVGAKVSPGQIISRGESFSGVTHLEYRKPGTSGITGTIDPLEYLRKLKIIEGGNTFKFKGAKKNEVSSLNSPMKLSPKQETQTPANYISNKKTYTDTTKETQILIQPIIT